MVGKCIFCVDGARNGIETDIDCGGGCTTKCLLTKGCTLPGDCDAANAECRSAHCSLPGMIFLPGGTFVMGAASGLPEESPPTSVSVAAFWLDQTEVTTSSYASCVSTGVCTSGGTGVGCNAGLVSERANHPINCVDEVQAGTYCNWQGKRLPSEAEWEFAASGSTGYVYPWGDVAPSATQICWSASLALTSTCPVGSFPAGDSVDLIRDLAGNVDEWTSSELCPYPYVAGATCGNAGRAVRGGAWTETLATNVRAARRYFVPLGTTSNLVGFRCARGN